MVEHELFIDKEFRGALRPLSEDELKTLEENLIRDGRKHKPILFWHDGERSVIVDGMHSYAILERLNSDKQVVDFRTEPMVFGNRTEALDWILSNQLGQRNFTSEERLECAGRLYNLRRGPQGGDMTNRVNVAQDLADELGVSAGAVRTSARVEAAKTKLSPAITKGISSGAIPEPTQQQTLALAKLAPSDQVQVACEVRKGQKTLQRSLEDRGALKKSAPKEKLIGHAKAWADQNDATKAERRQMSALSYSDQGEVMDLLANGSELKTLGAAIGEWSKRQAETPSGKKQSAAEVAKRHIKGMVATIDTLRKGIHEVIESLGSRPDPDYAKDALDALDVARIAMNKWGKVR